MFTNKVKLNYSDPINLLRNVPFENSLVKLLQIET